MNRDTFLVIVGAGPSGLMLACQCVKYQVPFIIIDSKKSISTVIKASLLSSRSLEILDTLGLKDRAMALGQKVDGFSVYPAHDPVIDFSYASVSTRFPFNLHLGQPNTEKILCDYLVAHGHVVLWEHECISFTQNDAEILLTIKNKDGLHTIRADYLVGADGASSRVRKQCDLAFTGSTYDNQYLVGDVKLDWAYSPDYARIFFNDDQFLMLNPIPDGRTQIIGNVLRSSVDDEPTADELKSLFSERCLLGGRIQDIRHLSYYRTHCRSLENLVINHVVLIGDAAHVLSPLTSLGMNIGLQDAENVGWKFDLIYRRIASVHLLQSYQEEQGAQFRRVVSLSNVLEALYCPNTDAKKNIRDFMIKQMRENDAIRYREVSRLMQTDSHYRGCALFQSEGEQSDLVGMKSPNPLFFLDRLNSNKHVLLFFSDAGADLSDVFSLSQDAQLREWISFCVIGSDHDGWHCITDDDRAIHAAFHIESLALVLIRPDRFVVYCAMPPSGANFLRYVSEKYRLQKRMR